MAFNSENSVPLWDFNSPGLNRINDDDFLSLLQKQFGLNMESNPNALDTAAVPVTDNTGVDPQSLLNFPHVQESPPSDDTSPSPPGSSSRRQSRIYGDGGEDNHKRKASDDDDLEEGPSHKQSSASRKSSTSRRKSGGGANPDDARLMKRKEQNRAAQRAFRERKEKHVKDLEDKVAELEAKNEQKSHENENLKELLQRLQQENVNLKQQNHQFTFSVPRPHSDPSSSRSPSHDPNGLFSMADGNSPMYYGEKPRSATTIGGIDWGNLPVYDATTLNLLENDPAFAAQVGFTSSFRNGMGMGPGPMMGVQSTNTMMANTTPYMTIASNPLYMSFADPPAGSNSNAGSTPSGSASTPSSVMGNTATSAFDSFAGSAFTPWPDTSASSMSGMETLMSLDDIFGGQYLQHPQPDLAFTFGPTSGPSPGSSSSLSPVVHQKSPSSNGGTPSSASSSTSPGTYNGCNGDEKTCPKTKDELAIHVNAQGMSPFAGASLPSAPTNASSMANAKSVINAHNHSHASSNAGMGATATMMSLSQAHTRPAATVSCKADGTSLPKTERSERNIEVLDAWREVTADPAFKDHDLMNLCALFSSKARCDGTKVVLEPSGMEDIKQSLATREREPKSAMTEFKI